MIRKLTLSAETIDILLIIAAVFIAWLALVPHSTYAHSWVYRTLQQGYNIEINVDFEFDGKPYSLNRILRCRKERLDGYDIFELISRHPHWDQINPDFSSFGIKTDSGEAVVINQHNICASRYIKFIRAGGDEIVPGSIDVPVGYVPAMAIVDNADAPAEIVIYASHQAYESPNARIKFKKIQFTIPKSWRQNQFFADSPDQFAFFGSKTDTHFGRNGSHLIFWRTIAFAELPMNDQGGTWQGFRLYDYDRKKIDDAEVLAYLDGQSSDTPITARNIGFMPNERASGPTRDRMRDEEYILENIIPYRLVNGIWEPQYGDRGRLILFSPRVNDDNRQSILGSAFYVRKTDNPVFHVFSRKIRLGGKVLDYEYLAYGAPTRSSDLYLDKIVNAAYLVENNMIYMPLHPRFETYEASTFR